MFCRKCGKEISDSAAFCNGCGASLQSAPEGKTVKTKKKSSRKPSEVHSSKKKLLVGIGASLVIIIILAIVIPLSIGGGSDSDDGSGSDVILSPRGNTGTVTTGESKELTSSTIDSSGGSIVVNEPGNPLDGMQLMVPAGSYSNSREFEISYAPIEDHTFGDAFNPVTPLIEIENGGDYSEEVMEVKIPVDVPEGYFAMG